MPRLFIACTALALFMVVSVSRAEEKKGHIGTWVPVEGTLAGQKMPDDALKPVKLVLAKDGYTAWHGELKETGTYKQDESAKPATVDITPGDGPRKGMTIKAICEVSGDTFKVCYNLQGGDRPKDFSSTAENKFLLFVYKRQK